MYVAHNNIKFFFDMAKLNPGDLWYMYDSKTLLQKMWSKLEIQDY